MLTTFRTKLVSKKELAPEVFLYRFELVEPTTVEFKAGQYLMLLCPQKDSYPLRRMYSIASPASQKNSFDLIVEIIPNGVGSNYFLAMKENDEVQFQGPAGMFTLHGSSPNRIFLATGTGIAPMISMLDEIYTSRNTDGTNQLFWGVPYIKDHYMLSDLISLKEKNSNFFFSISVSRERNLDSLNGEKEYFKLGRITKTLDEKYGNTFPKDVDFYLCGGRTVVESLRQYLAEKNVPKERIIFEKF
jgi:Na+-transporting NADH:ubiquinone oxidoreductase subunit F